MQTLTTKLPKVYVAVRAEFDEFGVMYPREITWEDGEKYEIEEMNFLLSQLVCEILYVEKYNETFFVFEHSKGRACSQGTVEYLRSRSLGGRIFLQASLTDTCPEQLKNTCAASTDKLFISPVLLCGKGEDQEALRSKIAETYPLGAVRWRSC